MLISYPFYLVVHSLELTSPPPPPPFFSVNSDLLKLVNRELVFEKKEFHKLPEIAGFTCTTNGAVASLRRMVNGEEIKIVLDANSKADMDMLGEESNDESDAEV